jgi:L-asparaginase II
MSFGTRLVLLAETHMNPVLVNRWRGNAIESRHRGAVAVVQSDGHAVMHLGDVRQPVFPRSAIKFFQAIPFVESGAVERFDLDERHIAMACASHNGEPIHVGLARDWLSRINATHDDLECGAELPSHQATAYELMNEGRGPERLHHNCSGKHLGFLSACRAHDDELLNYRLYNHRAQRRWFDVIETFCSTRVDQLPWGYDGCAIPTLALPLHRVALAMARFGDLQRLEGQRRESVSRIHAALAAHPYLVAGKERLDTDLMERLAPSIMVKVGADGVFTASIPDAGLGIALKIDDGRDSAARVAIGAVLSRLGLISSEDARALGEWFKPSISNSRGEVVGREEPSSAWDAVAPLSSHLPQPSPQPLQQ